jgi:hypothetical protein
MVTGNFENSEQLVKESGLFFGRHKLRPGVRGILQTDDDLNRGRAQKKLSPDSSFDTLADDLRPVNFRGDGDQWPAFPGVCQKSRILLIVGIYDGDQPGDPSRAERCSQTARGQGPITTASRRDSSVHRQLLPFEIPFAQAACVDVTGLP